MTHDEATAEFSALIDGALQTPRRNEVESHLAGCGSCQERLSELRGSIALFKKHGRYEAPALLKTRILAKAQEGQEAVSGWGVWKPALGWSFAVAGMLLVSAKVLKMSLPGVFEEEPPVVEGMISSIDDLKGAPEFAESEQKVASMNGRNQPEAKAAPRSATPSRRPAQAVELEAMGAGGSGAGSSDTEDTLKRFAARSRRDESDQEDGSVLQAPGPQARYRVFRDASSFKGWWSHLTTIPAPDLEFSDMMVVALTDPPSGHIWSVVGHEESPDGKQLRILYRESPAPSAAVAGKTFAMAPAAAPVPPAYTTVPRSDRQIVLIKR